MVRLGGLKLIRNHASMPELFSRERPGGLWATRPATGLAFTGEWEIYDLESDPLEQASATDLDPATVQTLRRWLESHDVRRGTVSLAPGLSPDVVEALRALGYL